MNKKTKNTYCYYITFLLLISCCEFHFHSFILVPTPTDLKYSSTCSSSASTCSLKTPVIRFGGNITKKDIYQ